MIVIDAKRNAVTCIGRLGENEARVIRINVSQIMRAFPGAAFTVLHRRPGDMDAYPVNGAYIAMDGENVLWTVASGDVEKEGVGQFEVVASVDGTIVKTVIYNSRVDHALDGSGDPPEPWESWQQQVAEDADRAEAAAQLLEHPGAEAETLAPGSSATAAYADGTFTFGIPQGEKGDQGQDGQDGQDGYSPTATVSKSGSTTTITITDKAGTTTAQISDGQDGQPGQDGADGFSPIATVSKSGTVATISITDKNGTTTAEVSDGDPTTLIDDTAGDGDTDKAWSADKLKGEFGDLKSAIGAVEESIAPVESTATATAAHAVGELFMLGETLMVALSAIAVGDTITTEGVTPNAAATTLSAKMIKDVQVNGTSVLSQGVANVPVAAIGTYGVLKVGTDSSGLVLDPSGYLKTSYSGSTECKSGTNYYKPIVPASQHIATFYALAKLAGADMASMSGETVGVYPEAQKIAIQKMLGIYQAPWELIREETFTNATSENYVISVDGNGQAFELTDVVLQIVIPSGETVVTTYGVVRIYYGSSSFVGAELGALSSAGSTDKYAGVYFRTEKNGSFFSFSKYASSGTAKPVNVRNGDDFLTGNVAINQIEFRAIQGKVNYKLYGKRKWT